MEGYHAACGLLWLRRISAVGGCGNGSAGGSKETFYRPGVDPAFCTPHKHTTKDTRDWIQPADEPEKWNLFKEYNRQDVIAERTIWERLATCQVPEMVEIQWRQNLLMNARGVCVDTQLVEGAIRAGDTAAQPLREEAQKLTGLENPNSPVQLKKYLTAQGCTVTTLRQEDLDTLLADATLPAKVKRVLAIRKELGKSSIKKYESARNVVCKDGRAHGLLSLDFCDCRLPDPAERLTGLCNE